jgi:hypothetical protein
MQQLLTGKRRVKVEAEEAERLTRRIRTANEPAVHAKVSGRIQRQNPGTDVTDQLTCPHD